MQEDQHEQNMSRILTNISDSSTMTSNQTHQVVQHGAIGKLVNLSYLFNIYVAPYVCKKNLNFPLCFISFQDRQCLVYSTTAISREGELKCTLVVTALVLPKAKP